MSLTQTITTTHIRPYDEHSAFLTIPAHTLSPLLCRKDAARYLGVSHQTLAQWAYNQRVALPYLKLGRRVFYRKADLDSFIAANIQVAAGSK